MAITDGLSLATVGVMMLIKWINKIAHHYQITTSVGTGILVVAIILRCAKPQKAHKEVDDDSDDEHGADDHDEDAKDDEGAYHESAEPASPGPESMELEAAPRASEPTSPGSPNTVPTLVVYF